MQRSILGWIVALVAGCASTGPGPVAPPTLAASLDPPPHTGDLVYRGAVTALSARTEDDPVYWYERRVLPDGDHVQSSHRTVDVHGAEVLLHLARHDADYSLRSFESWQHQTGSYGRLDIHSDGRVEIRVREDGRTRIRRERAGAPVVVGPTLFGWILGHWDALLAGERLPVRFAAIDRGRTYGFWLEKAESDPGRVVVTMSATSPIVRLAIAPMRITFDASSRRVLSFEGRVPPLVASTRGLVPLDARVDYEMLAADYR